MRRVLILAALLVLLSVGVSAYEVPEDFTGMTLDQVMEDFRQAHQLKDWNFSISYYNTVTGESYAWNDTWFSIAASTYKLPLNMYFYEMQQSGELTGDTVITWTGRTLDEIHRESIVNSNNELSEALMWYWGSHETYKQNMRKYFTMTDEEIHPSYWQANWYCTRMMMDCLKYLYDNQENFGELIGYMKEAMPDQYFKGGVTEYEVAHKYGAVQIYFNDVGIIYAPQPILLAVYTAGLPGEGICADAAALLTAWSDWQAAQNPVEPETPEEPEVPEPEETPGRHELPVTEVPVPEKLPEEPEPEPQIPVPEPDEPQEAPAEPRRQKNGALIAAVIGIAASALLLAVGLRRRR